MENRMKIGYLDSHCHLMGEEFEEDLSDVIKRCDDANIDHMMIIALSEEDAKRAMEFAARDRERYAVAVGIFPEDAAKVTEEDWQKFVTIAGDPRVDVIGEIGLEYHWVKDPEERALQRELFIRQIELAKELNKPIAVHARDAMQDCFDIMKEHSCKGLMHCFAGTKEMAIEFTKLGYYLAFGGALTFKNARHSVEAVKAVDSKYLLTETDCPYMAPEPFRGKRNEPSFIPYILRKMAEVKEIGEEEMAGIVEENWQRYLHG